MIDSLTIADDAAVIFNTDPAVNSIAFWNDGWDDHVWPFATVDNRRSRVVHRIVNWLGTDPACLDSLTIVHR